MSAETPNPGSEAAQSQGCECPVLDNGHGRGWMGGAKGRNGETMFVIVYGCPLHAPPSLMDAAGPLQREERTMSLHDIFRSKKTPPSATAWHPIAVPAKKPIDVAERDEAIEALGDLNAVLNENDLVIARAQDKRRRLLLAIEGRKAQLDVHERPEREMLNKVADTFDAAFSDLPDISTAIADAPEEMREAAE